MDGNLTGKMLFRQTDGNLTYFRDSGELASDIPTVVSFELSDPRHRLRSATFTYTWDLGNGEVVVGPEPYIHCSYSKSGNYTFKLRIGANTTRHSSFTGVYSKDLIVLDAIRSIELRSSSSYQVDKSSNLYFRVAGSTPMWLCWRVLPDCSAVSSTVSCNLMRVYENNFILNYTFTSVGTHCMDLNAQNDISELRTSYSIFVQRNPLHHLFFILPCASLILATVGFISATVCHPRHSLLKSKSKVSAISYLSLSDIEMKPKDVECSVMRPPTFSAEKSESHPLLHHSGSYNTTDPC
ncbi:transmembrane protein 130 [Chanos chanos]|uniref:Transmembrane protein 130 n=1 Tax=Chanos chanos TaxID=29144 RepID=A0A6J2VI65_CHACN|nr:transmembrane protein 130 [Chanos chanos]